MAVAAPRPAVGVLPGAVSGARGVRAGNLRRTRHGRCAVGVAPLLRCMVRRGRQTQGRRCRGWVSAAAAVHDAGPLLPRHLHPRPAQGRVRIPTARGCQPLWVRLARPIPYPAEQVRSITLLSDGGRLYLDVTAEVPVTTYPPGLEPDPNRVAGVDLGVIHPYAVAGPDGWGTAGVGPGDPRRASHAPGRHQSPPAGGRRPGTQTRPARVTPLAPIPAPATAGRGPPPASGPSSHARSGQDGGR